MKPVPTLLIATDRGHLNAYRSQSNGSMLQIDAIGFEEGNSRLSDLVTDQAGAFPVAGTPGTGHAERPKLEGELQARCIRQIAERIEQLVRSEKPDIWGLSAPAEINKSILESLRPQTRDLLAVNLKLNLTNVAPQELHGHFVKAREQEQALK